MNNILIRIEGDTSNDNLMVARLVQMHLAKLGLQTDVVDEFNPGIELDKDVVDGLAKRASVGICTSVRDEKHAMKAERVHAKMAHFTGPERRQGQNMRYYVGVGGEVPSSTWAGETRPSLSDYAAVYGQGQDKQMVGQKNYMGGDEDKQMASSAEELPDEASWLPGDDEVVRRLAKKAKLMGKEALLAKMKSKGAYFHGGPAKDEMPTPHMAVHLPILHMAELLERFADIELEGKLVKRVWLNPTNFNQLRMYSPPHHFDIVVQREVIATGLRAQLHGTDICVSPKIPEGKAAFVAVDPKEFCAREEDYIRVPPSEDTFVDLFPSRI